MCFSTVLAGEKTKVEKILNLFMKSWFFFILIFSSRKLSIIRTIAKLNLNFLQILLREKKIGRYLLIIINKNSKLSIIIITNFGDIWQAYILQLTYQQLTIKICTIEIWIVSIFKVWISMVLTLMIKCSRLLTSGLSTVELCSTKKIE